MLNHVLFFYYYTMKVCLLKKKEKRYHCIALECFNQDNYQVIEMSRNVVYEVIKVQRMKSSPQEMKYMRE